MERAANIESTYVKRSAVGDEQSAAAAVLMEDIRDRCETKFYEISLGPNSEFGPKLFF